MVSHVGGRLEFNRADEVIEAGLQGRLSLMLPMLKDQIVALS